MRKQVFSLMAAACLVGVSATASFARVEKVVLSVEGLSCPFCAYGLEKKITRVDGVTSYEIDMPRGRVAVAVSEDARISLAMFRAAVKEAGFTLSGATARVTGKVRQGKQGWVLITEPSGQEILLFESEETAGRLGDHAGTGSRIRVEGPVHDHEGLPLGLAVESLEVLE